MPRIKDIYCNSLLPGIYNRVINLIHTNFAPENKSTVLKFDISDGNVYYLCNENFGKLITTNKLYGSLIKSIEIDKYNFPVYTENDIYIGYVDEGIFHKTKQQKLDISPENIQINNYIINKIRFINTSLINPKIVYMFDTITGVTALVNERSSPVMYEILCTTPTVDMFEYTGAYYIHSNWYPIFNNRNEYVTFHKPGDLFAAD